MSRTTGLALGKFAPFHKGHQLIIETALTEVEHLSVMVYDTDVTPVPLQVRAGWIKALYPSVEIIETWDGPPGYGDDPQTKSEQEEYILKRLGGRSVTHFYSSEFYGDHVSKALGAIDRRVDEARTRVPISGTAIRSDPYRHRSMLDPIVYRDLITKACFIGAPSTGKSTIAKALAEHFNTKYMPEYGADYWLANHGDRRLTIEQFEEIAPEHIKREDNLLAESNRYLFCDTCPITTYHFAKDYLGTAGPTLSSYARECERRYDLFFLCETDIPYADTWDRSGPQKREWFQNLIIADMAERRLPFIRLRGNLDQRVNTVSQVLRRFPKYTNPWDHLSDWSSLLDEAAL